MNESSLANVVSMVKARDGNMHSFVDQIDISPFDDLEILETAIACKEAGWEIGGLEVAEKLFKRLLDKSPSYAAAWYELAIVHRFQKRLAAALSAATQAAQHAPQELRIRVFHAHMLYANGCWDEGDTVLQGAPVINDAERREVAAMRSFGIYLKEFPRERARFITEEIRRRHYWVSVEELADKIKNAIKERIPFALIRLGDGEGTFARISQEDEFKFADLYQHCREFWTRFLMGPDFDPTWTGYNSLTDQLMPFVAKADVLGVAYWDWVDYEYSIAADRTIPCLLNINRYVFEKLDSITLCNQDVHVQLHRTGLLHDLMRDVSQITVISCLDGLDKKIQEMFEIADVQQILVPSENYAPHLAHIAKVERRPHFPQIFWDLMYQLKSPHNGRVFLIAAGTFGKYYAGVIKENGGIALDLGSVVDGWMKLASRPFYTTEFQID